MPETQLSDQTADNELTCGARQKTRTSGKLKKNKNKQHTVEKSKDAYCLIQNGCSHNRTENADMLQCSHCGVWHHFDCVGLISSDAVGVWPCCPSWRTSRLLNNPTLILLDCWPRKLQNVKPCGRNLKPTNHHQPHRLHVLASHQLKPFYCWETLSFVIYGRQKVTTLR